MVILSDDLFSIDPAKIRDVKALTTARRRRGAGGTLRTARIPRSTPAATELSD
jgi:hypothetical protein